MMLLLCGFILSFRFVSDDGKGSGATHIHVIGSLGCFCAFFRFGLVTADGWMGFLYSIGTLRRT